MENTLRKFLCKLKGSVKIEQKSSITYEVHCTNCQAVYFGESKQLNGHMRSVKNCDMKVN